MLISRRREAKRRALLQMLDRIPVRTGTKTPAPLVRPLPVDVPLPTGAPSRDGIPPVKQ